MGSILTQKLNIATFSPLFKYFECIKPLIWTQADSRQFYAYLVPKTSCGDKYAGIYSI